MTKFKKIANIISWCIIYSVIIIMLPSAITNTVKRTIDDPIRSIVILAIVIFVNYGLWENKKSLK